MSEHAEDIHGCLDVSYVRRLERRKIQYTIVSVARIGRVSGGKSRAMQTVIAGSKRSMEDNSRCCSDICMVVYNLLQARYNFK